MTNPNYSNGGTGLDDEPAVNTTYRLPAVPERLPPATEFAERLRRWGLVRRAPEFDERPEVRAGRVGEQSTRHWARQHLVQAIGTLFGGKRVPRDPNAAAMGRYEIDLLVVTPRRVVALETKNWSGRLRVEGERWVQERVNMEVRVLDDLISYNRGKLKAVQQYLQHCGVDLPKERFHHALIFGNRNLEIDPQLAAHPAVISGPQVGVVVGQPISSMRFTLARIIESCAKAENAKAISEHFLDIMTPSQKEAACEAIAKLRTWDQVRLRGGRTLQGDLLWLRQGNQTFSAGQFERDRTMQLRWKRGYLDGALGILPNYARGHTYGALMGKKSAWRVQSAPIDVDDCLYFHEVGETTPSVIALTSVERIQIG